MQVRRFLMPLLAVGLFTATHCSGSRSRPLLSSTGSTTIGTIAPQGQSFQSFASAKEAISYLIARFSPNTIAFGEFHKTDAFDCISTSFRFGREIIPVLEANHYDDLIAEFIPNDPKVEQELVFYNRERRLDAKRTPLLIDWTNGTDEE